MKYEKYVGTGIAVLVVVCLLVSSVAAAKTTLKEGDVALGVSATKEAYTIYNQFYETRCLGLRLDSDLRQFEYQKYYVYTGILNNKTGVTYEKIPSVVIQPINIKRGSVIYGTGTLKVWKKGIADAAQKLVYVDYEFDINMNQTWQNSIGSDQSLRITSTDADSYYNNLFVYYGALGGSHPQRPSFKFGLDRLNRYSTFADENGISVFVCGFGKLLGSNRPYEQTDITYQTNFYNEYGIYADDAGFKEINIIRICSKCADKFTKSKVYVLDKEGDLLFNSPFEQDVNSHYSFPAEPLVIWLVAANMEADGGDKRVLIYDDTAHPEYCYMTGFTYDAKIGTIIRDVKVDMGFERVDYSDTSGYYSIGFPEGVYTITASKAGFYDTTFPSIAFPLGGDYMMDIALVSKPPVDANPSILGLVRELPHYHPVENQEVKIENMTWMGTTTTNEFGHYIFPDLEAGDYIIDVSRRGYAPNTHLLTVSDFHVLHNIDLEPKEANIIEILVEKIMEWWLLLLLLIALVVGGLLVRGKGKKTHHRRRR